MFGWCLLLFVVAAVAVAAVAAVVLRSNYIGNCIERGVTIPTPSLNTFHCVIVQQWIIRSAGAAMTYLLPPITNFIAHCPTVVHDSIVSAVVE